MSPAAPITIACIGSRETPPEILAWMRQAGETLVASGYCLISGNAPGADQAWAAGGNKADPAKVTLCLPWETFEQHAIHPENGVRVLARRETEGEKRYYSLAAATHPRWLELTMGAQRLHARNAVVVDASRAVLGYVTRDSWGTASAFRIARMLNVPAFNVHDEAVRGNYLDIVKRAVRR